MKLLASISILLLILTGCGTVPPTEVNDTESYSGRLPVAEGIYYPKDAETLRNVLAGFFEEARESDETSRARMIIAPNNQYVYSGIVAADAYNQIDSDFDRVIILADLKGFEGIATPDYESYRTPLGDVELDTEIIAQLSNMGAGHIREATQLVEVQLPFLQTRLNEFTIAPIFVGELGLSELNLLSTLLVNLTDERTLVVLSTDFTTNKPYLETFRTDTPCMSAINRLLLNDIITDCQVTSKNSLLAFVSAARAMDLEPDTITYKTSAETAGGKERVTGFAAFAFREQNQ